MPFGVAVRSGRSFTLPVLIVCLSTLAHAQQPDAPPATVAADAAPVETSMVGVDDAFTTGASLSELELTVLYSEAVRKFGSDGDTSDRATNGASLGVVTLTHGLSERLDLTASAFGVSYVDEDEPQSRGRGLGDLFIDFKWRFHGDGVGGFNLAYRPGLSIPIGNDDAGNAQAPGLGFWTVSQALLVTLVERRWVLGLEGGLLIPIDAPDGTPTPGLAGFGVGYQATPRVKPEVELSYLRDIVLGQPDSELLAVTGGLVVNAADSIRIDLGLRHGIWGRDTDQRYTGSVNVSFTFGGPPSVSGR